jgi:hypothetical protein
MSFNITLLGALKTADPPAANPTYGMMVKKREDADPDG